LDLGEPLPPKKFPPPSIRDRLSPELEREFQEALGDVSVDALMTGPDTLTGQTSLEPESRHLARVIAVQRDDVFVELGGREQGILSVRLFTEPPQPNASFEVIVTRFNSEDGLYELGLPGMATAVGDWSQLSEGMLVEVRVTGHNTGGLECEVSRIRGFIPISQISLYRVEDLAEYVGQKLTCTVTEANPERRNLVLSRRAVLEREKEEARRTLMESLTPGQICEGVVRRLMDFGAFVDLGSGVDGLVHVSQLGWGRIKHPSEVLQEGQRISVRVDKVSPDTGRISLGYRELVEENPWTLAEGRYLPNTPHHGRVVKVMEFGAFVELEPGVEGLVHISELGHRRVARVTDVVKEGDEIDVMVLSADAANRRISLSMKHLLPPPEPERPAAAQAAPAEPVPPAKPKRQPPAKPLHGGLGRSPGGKSFGLNW
jgi:small subunit ribosomal protein S1